ncbi:unnamed protein product [Oikopleura dioica]|uniref:Uncharacterized protein n=1 Tax=Oikopleura dioica TaxID=34765 RepID=E4YC04_OIKDI|nr:unnamed protein product [Oikopleura dioica]
MDKFAGSIAIVTGGSAGIGKALIKRLLEKSSNLTVIGIARRPIDEFSSFPNFRSIQCDVSKADQIQSMISTVQSEFSGKSVQILVNNAGHGKPLPLIDHSSLNDPATIQVENLEDVSKVYASQLNTNVLGLSLMTRAVSKLMDHQKCGNIVNINSMSGQRVVPTPNSHMYSATKFAVTALTEGTRQELRVINSSIRANQISPGYVDTDFFQAFSMEQGYQEKMKEVVKTAITSEDIVDSIMLCIEAQPGCQIGDIQMRPTVQIL